MKICNYDAGLWIVLQALFCKVDLAIVMNRISISTLCHGKFTLWSQLNLNPLTMDLNVLRITPKCPFVPPQIVLVWQIQLLYLVGADDKDSEIISCHVVVEISDSLTLTQSWIVKCVVLWPTWRRRFKSTCLPINIVSLSHFRNTINQILDPIQ